MYVCVRASVCLCVCVCVCARVCVCMLLLFVVVVLGGAKRLGERGGSEGLRDCVYVSVRVCSCVDAVEGEGLSEICNAY